LAWPTLCFDAGPVGRFPRSSALTDDGSIRVVETPGHMVGHVSLVARAADVTYIVAGDVTYRERNLLADAVDGVTFNVAKSLRSQRAVKALAAEEPCVLLPGHDPDVPRRLEGRICIPANKDAVTHAAEPRSRGRLPRSRSRGDQTVDIDSTA
jgi:N-acyl homoserine lactone hydrolase